LLGEPGTRNTFRLIEGVDSSEAQVFR
jgi:hypothetical protein